jgi:hypothetical protein
LQGLTHWVTIEPLSTNLKEKKMTNCKLKEGDHVSLTKHRRADIGYVHHADIDPGSHNNLCIPAGAVGVVVQTRLPRLVYKKGGCCYFANVDFVINGRTVRVRCTHDNLRLIRHNTPTTCKV